MDYLDKNLYKFNQEKTDALTQDQNLIQYKEWLVANKCVFPSVRKIKVDFPVAFGESGVAGVMAKSDIPSKKAFLFIPYTIIITPQVAKATAINEVFLSCPELFRDQRNSMDYILWVFLMWEKTKGQASFYNSYFNVIRKPEILSDWTDDELNELQDPFLFLKAKKYYKDILDIYDSLIPVFNKFPQYFPPES